MLVYAFEPGAIQGRAVEALTAALSGALVTTDRIARDAHLPPGRSPVFYAHVLLGGRGDERATALAAAIAAAAGRADAGIETDPAENAYAAEELAEVLDRLQPFFGAGATPAARRTLTESVPQQAGRTAGRRALVVPGPAHRHLAADPHRAPLRGDQRRRRRQRPATERAAHRVPVGDADVLAAGGDLRRPAPGGGSRAGRCRCSPTSWRCSPGPARRC